MKNITIFVGSENKGLNISIGHVLAEEYLHNVNQARLLEEFRIKANE